MNTGFPDAATSPDHAPSFATHEIGDLIWGNQARQVEFYWAVGQVVAQGLKLPTE